MTHTVGAGRASPKALVGWCFYDWANSSFPTIVETFVFSTYFAKAVAPDIETGTALWGYALALAGITVALAAPFVGAIADRCGGRKPFLAAFTVILSLCAAGLWFAKPSPDYVVWTLACFAIGTVAFEFGMTFYNAMLPGLAESKYLGRLSGWGWGTGYAGGLLALATVLLLIKSNPPFFGLDAVSQEPVRAAGLVVAAWVVVFALPLFLWTPDRRATGEPLGRAMRDGARHLFSTLRGIRQHKQIARFLFARMIYMDGLNTVFAFGSIYAAGSFGMSFEEILAFGIAINVTAGLGAAGFAWIDDWIGPKRTIVLALLGLIGFGAALLLVESKAAFFVLGLFLGLFFGPAQAASRSLMAHMSPPGQEAEMFGLYAFTGRATAFVGPLLFGWATIVLESQRAGMATALGLVILGLLLLLPVRAPKFAR
jgi:MFS transporter, UMF1 family